MLLVKFKIDNEYYAINTDSVIEIVPAIQFRTIPGTPDFFLGLFDYRGQIIPVIDITQLTVHRPSEMRLSTRVILIHFPYENHNTILGLLAEDITDVIDIDESKFQDTHIHPKKALHLGPLCEFQGQFIQLIVIENLLPKSVQQNLFSLT